MAQCLPSIFEFQEGQLRAYNVGKALRERYGSFLGEKYNIKLIEGRSSNFNRTKDTLQVVLAGLFPPIAGEEFLREIKWQPIPYNFVERDKDKVRFYQSLMIYLNYS